MKLYTPGMPIEADAFEAEPFDVETKGAADDDDPYFE